MCQRCRAAARTCGESRAGDRRARRCRRDAGSSGAAAARREPRPGSGWRHCWRRPRLRGRRGSGPLRTDGHPAASDGRSGPGGARVCAHGDDRKRDALRPCARSQTCASERGRRVEGWWPHVGGNAAPPHAARPRQRPDRPRVRARRCRRTAIAQLRLDYRHRSRLPARRRHDGVARASDGALRRECLERFLSTRGRAGPRAAGRRCRGVQLGSAVERLR